MSAKSKSLKLLRLVTKLDIFLSESSPLFILSHMRSRSSLLSHIMGSNPEILGYSEMAIDYERRFAYQKLKGMLLSEFPQRNKPRFYLDKILHDKYRLPNRIMQRGAVLFLLREPNETVISIQKLGRLMKNENMSNLENAMDYYVSRLTALERLAERAPDNSRFLDSSRLVEQTDEVLLLMTQWLGLRQSLDSEYDLFQNTGRAGSGDTSNRLKSGSIQRMSSTEQPLVSVEGIDRAEAAYKRVRQSIASRVEML